MKIKNKKKAIIKDFLVPTTIEEYEQVRNILHKKIEAQNKDLIELNKKLKIKKDIINKLQKIKNPKIEIYENKIFEVINRYVDYVEMFNKEIINLKIILQNSK